MEQSKDLRYSEILTLTIKLNKQNVKNNYKEIELLLNESINKPQFLSFNFERLGIKGLLKETPSILYNILF